jgi:hypothetical protein
MFENAEIETGNERVAQVDRLKRGRVPAELAS